jgi:hypothetical protein
MGYRVPAFGDGAVYATPPDPADVGLQPPAALSRAAISACP